MTAWRTRGAGWLTLLLWLCASCDKEDTEAWPKSPCDADELGRRLGECVEDDRLRAALYLLPYPGDADASLRADGSRLVALKLSVGADFPLSNAAVQLLVEGGSVLPSSSPGDFKTDAAGSLLVYIRVGAAAGSLVVRVTVVGSGSTYLGTLSLGVDLPGQQGHGRTVELLGPEQIRADDPTTLRAVAYRDTDRSAPVPDGSLIVLCSVDGTVAKITTPVLPTKAGMAEFEVSVAPAASGTTLTFYACDAAIACSMASDTAVKGGACAEHGVTVQPAAGPIKRVFLAPLGTVPANEEQTISILGFADQARTRPGTQGAPVQLCADPERLRLASYWVRLDAAGAAQAKFTALPPPGATESVEICLEACPFDSACDAGADAGCDRRCGRVEQADAGGATQTLKRIVLSQPGRVQIGVENALSVVGFGDDAKTKLAADGTLLQVCADSAQLRVGSGWVRLDGNGQALVKFTAIAPADAGSEVCIAICPFDKSCNSDAGALHSSCARTCPKVEAGPPLIASVHAFAPSRVAVGEEFTLRAFAFANRDQTLPAADGGILTICADGFALDDDRLVLTDGDGRASTKLKASQVQNRVISVCPGSVETCDGSYCDRVPVEVVSAVDGGA